MSGPNFVFGILPKKKPKKQILLLLLLKYDWFTMFFLVLGVQQSDSVTHIHVSILFQILFPIRLLQNIEQNFLRYTVVGPVTYAF